MTTQAMTFRLQGRDDMSPVFRRAGASVRRLEGDLDRASRNGSDALGRLGGAATGAATAIGSGGSGGGGLGGAVAGLGAIVGLSALPALGAFVPMLAGAGLAAVTAKVAFAGVGEAVTLASEDQEEYAKVLKKMGPEQRAFTKTLVAGKKEFAGFGKEIQKIALPGFTAGLKAAAPAADVLKGSMRDMAGVLGRLGRDAGEFIGSDRFGDSLRRNFELGSTFVDKFARSLGPFTQGLLDFGAASKPTLDAFSSGLSGLMAKGLPGFFKGLETGIGGASDVLDGLFYVINRVLPAFGELSGAVSKAFGPLLKELFAGAADRGAAALELLAGAAKAAAPVLKDVAFGLKLSNELFRIMGGAVKDAAGVLIDTFLPASGQVDKMRGPFQRLYDVFKRNESTIRDAARQFSGFVVGIAETTLTHLPAAFAAFRTLATTALDAMGSIVNGMAKLVGVVPGIGPKVKDAAKSFNEFHANAKRNLDNAGKDINKFAADTLPKLRDNKLKMDIRQWEGQIKRAKHQISDKNLPPKKKATLEADIRRWSENIRKAKDQIGGVKGKGVKLSVTSNASGMAASVRATLRNIPDENVYVRVSRIGLGEVARRAGARGGLVPYGLQRLQGGGPVRGPGTETSDSILARLSKNEYVIRAAAVRKYGARMFDQLNAMRAPVQTAAPTVAAPARSAAPVTINNTYHLTQRDMTVRDLDNLQRKQAAYHRFGYPR